jgi:hypothetical protein
MASEHGHSLILENIKEKITNEQLRVQAVTCVPSRAQMKKYFGIDRQTLLTALPEHTAQEGDYQAEENEVVNQVVSLMRGPRLRVAAQAERLRDCLTEVVSGERKLRARRQVKTVTVADLHSELERFRRFRRLTDDTLVHAAESVLDSLDNGCDHKDLNRYNTVAREMVRLLEGLIAAARDEEAAIESFMVFSDTVRDGDYESAVA